MNKIEYTVVRSGRRTVGLQIKNGVLTVRAPKKLSNKAIAAIVEERRAWIEKHLKPAVCLPPFSAEELDTLMARAEEYIPARVRYYAGLMGPEYGKLKIKTLRSRWGSCSSRGNLNFNCLLMLAPPQVIDSVVVHELCHLRQMNHSSRFYAEVLKYYPEYYKWHPWLKENGGGILGRL